MEETEQTEQKLDKASLKWIEEQEELMQVGQDIVKQASDEALEYVQDALEHINDRAWRKMSMSTQIVEMGVGVALAEHLVPVIYRGMERSLHKKIKVTKEVSRALRHIYIGRVMKNVRKALNNRVDS